jgi:peptidoglycan/LPS O-acetylase OafA/YrhL
MGILRIILALAVIVTHAGSLAGLRFFGGGEMPVETFFLLSGFYMALVLSTRYRGRTRDFYFNRFLRLFPLYWGFVTLFFVLSAGYWLATGHPLGALAAWHKCHDLFFEAWSLVSNVAIVGTDWAEIYGFRPALGGDSVNRLIAIQPAWTLAVEITFYLGAPFVLRRSRWTQTALFFAALVLRYGLWIANGSQLTVWTRFFFPATWVFFLGGVQAYHLMTWLEKRPWFQAAARPVGHGLVALLVLAIVFYDQDGILRYQDWRYYTAVGVALPFLFTAFRGSPFDSALASLSYPLYLAHWVVLSLYPPLRHFVPGSAQIYAVVALSVLLSVAAVHWDAKIQARFKRAG